MPSWKEFARLAPEIVAFGLSRFQSRVAYLGTLRADGSPRVHPVTPIVGDQLFLFMEPTSPKGKDLMRDARYTLHCAVEDSDGGNGEFYVRGRTKLINDPRVWAEAALVSSYVPQAHYILFTFSIEFAFMNIYIDGKSDSQHWSSTG